MDECQKCGRQRDCPTKLCRSCYGKEWRARQTGRVCPTCGKSKPVFTKKDQCSTCYHRERTKKLIGTCSKCGKVRKLPSNGRCGYCNHERTRQTKPPIVCLQCGRLAPHFAKRLCRSCYTNNTKRRGKYGITSDEYIAMVKDQRGLCAICDRPMTRHPHVDHDHDTGVIRGLLCYTCNVGLGSFGDDPERLRAAAKYVEAHKARKVA